jgi:twitching motility protein PilU
MDTPYIKDLIKRAEVDTIKEGMEQGVQEGCQTFDQALFVLYKEGKISLEQALINADSANNLRLKIKLAGLKCDQEPDMAELVAKEQKHPAQAAPKSANAFRLRA